MAIQIRKLNTADAMIYRDARLRALRMAPEAFGASYSEEASMPEERFAELLTVKEDAPDDFVLGAFSEQSPLAGFVGFLRAKGPKQLHKGFLWGTYVDPEVRGQGVGKALVEQVVSEARRIEDLRFIRLKVVSTNNVARALYESVGFVEYGQEVEAIKVGSLYYDQTLMRLAL